MSAPELFALAFLLFPPGFLLLLVWQKLTGHRWVYRSPYTRTCRHCDRQEDWHCWAEYAHRPAGSALHGDGGWWEEMRPGAGEKCRRVTHARG